MSQRKPTDQHPAGRQISFAATVARQARELSFYKNETYLLQQDICDRDERIAILEAQLKTHEKAQPK